MKKVGGVLFAIVIGLSAFLLTACKSEVKEDFVSTWEGETIEFGCYPQSLVADEGLLGALNALLNGVPTAADAQGWTSYRFKMKGQQSDFAWYRDVDYGEARYRAVYMSQYRPNYTGANGGAHLSYQDDNGYRTKQVYWFRFEPIRWQVLKTEEGSALLLSAVVLDSYQFAANENNYYPDSEIRAWINADFYETAFTAEEQGRIAVTTVANDLESVWQNRYGHNSFTAPETQDKVFLLSYREAVTAAYGFSTDDTVADTARARLSTAYARIQGVQAAANGTATWWLRSPYHNAGNYACSVEATGELSSHRTNYVFYGVCPAITLTIA